MKNNHNDDKKLRINDTNVWLLENRNKINKPIGSLPKEGKKTHVSIN